MVKSFYSPVPESPRRGMLASKRRSFAFGGNGEESLAEVPQSGTKAGLKEGFGEVSPFTFGKPRDLSRGGFTMNRKL